MTCQWCGGPATHRIVSVVLDEVKESFWCETHSALADRGLRSKRAQGYGGAWRVVPL